MVFNSNVFLFAFLPVVFAAFWLSRTKQQRYVVLTVSGYVFYGYWDWRFCWLLLFSSVVSFTAGLMIDGAQSRAAKRAWMVASVATDLSLLGFFKYYNFVPATSPGWRRVRRLRCCTSCCPSGSASTLSTLSPTSWTWPPAACGPRGASSSTWPT